MKSETKLTQEEQEALIGKAYHQYIENDPVVKRHTDDTGWISGSSTYVPPVGLWVENGEIRIQLKINRNVFKKAIERIIKASEGLIIDADFCKYDGSCPDELVFYTNWSWVAGLRNKKK